MKATWTAKHASAFFLACLLPDIAIAAQVEITGSMGASVYQAVRTALNYRGSLALRKMQGAHLGDYIIVCGLAKFETAGTKPFIASYDPATQLSLLTKLDDSDSMASVVEMFCGELGLHLRE